MRENVPTTVLPILRFSQTTSYRNTIILQKKKKKRKNSIICKEILDV